MQLTWSEMPNYQDFVIPKTELFYRSTLVETVDMSVEIHLWRRKLACVKRFKFDLLTRDNIKYFKDEANIFKKLSHENIVRFYGILIDPPSLGIVMHFCTNSDVFKKIEKLRLELREEKVKAEEMTVSVFNPLSSSASSSSKDREVSKEKEPPSLCRLAPHGRFLTIYDDHVVHSAVSMEEELQPLRPSEEKSSDDDLEEGRAGKLIEATKHDSSQPQPQRRVQRHSHRFTLKMSGPSHRVSSVRHLETETKNTFEPMLIALQVCRGMAYLHSQGITHRDVKSLNVLLDENFNAQIADFGESSFGEISSAGGAGLKMAEMGTPGWAAPELILGEGVSKASDVFSFGIILWELLTFRAPSVLIDMAMLQMPEVSNLPSTFNHPLLKKLKNQNQNQRDESTDKNSISSASTNASGFSVFFERKQTQNPASVSERTALIQDHDMTMIEIGDLHTARVLMCDLKLRPPMPCNIPSTLRKILVSCWRVNEADRPSFSEVYHDLEKMLVNQEFDKIDIPCDVEAVVNISSSANSRLSSSEKAPSASTTSLSSVDYLTENI